MTSRNWVLVIIQFSILTHLPGITITHGDSVCGTQGTYKPNSAYQKSLDEALSALAETHNGDGFFRSPSDSAQDDQTSTAYALALCPGEFDEDKCLRCVNSATNGLILECPNQKKATGWFHDICMLSYSNSTLDRFVLRYQELRNWDSIFQTGLGDLFRLLVDEAANDYSKTFYSGNTTLPGSRGYIQAIMQCIPNISQNICAECFENATNYLLTCCGRSTQGVIYFRYPCFLRYVIYSVGVEVASSPTPFSLVPPPMSQTTPSTIPPQGKGRSNVIGPAIAAAAATLAVSTFFICLNFLQELQSKRGRGRAV